MNTFESNENKGLLWKLMYENNVFSNIPSDNVNKVKDLLETEVNIMKSSNGSILEKNKAVMKNIIDKISTLKKPIDTPLAVTSEDFLKNRQNTIGKKFEERQKEFNSLFEVKKPQSPQFVDKLNDEPIGSDMKNIVAAAMAKRESDLQTAMSNQDRNAAEKWLSGKSTSETKLIIGEKIAPPKTSHITPNRKVTFKEPENYNEKSSLFDRFKKSEQINTTSNTTSNTMSNTMSFKIQKIRTLLSEIEKIISTFEPHDIK